MTYDPPRLKDGADTPRELGAALDALRRGPGDAARVGRVAAKLGPLLDAAPPASVALPPRLPRIGLQTFKAARLFLAGMAVGASVLWLSRWQREPAAPPQPQAHAPVSASEASLPPSMSAPAAHAERPTLSNDEGGNLASSPPLPRVAPRPLSELSRAAAAAPRAPRPSTARARVVGSRASSVRGESSSSVAAPQSQAEQSATVARPPSEPEPPAAPPDPPKGEVELLFEARTLRQRAPREALSLLDQHAARFPSGMLAPEREAMAIEILRALGRTQQADERLARYRAHYPHSLHLPRLEKAR